MIGERLLDLRKDAGLTQDELAIILKINKHSISAYERSKSEPSDSLKTLMAAYFGVSVDYLLGITDNPTPYTNAKNYVRVPIQFPPSAISEVKNFIEYLSYKYFKISSAKNSL